MNIYDMVTTPSSAAAVFFVAMSTDCREERVFVLPLDGNSRALAKPILVTGGHEDGTAQIDVGLIFRDVLKAGVEEIIVAYNHPSGYLTPSKADIESMAKLREAGELLGIPLVDYLIFGNQTAGDGGPPAFVSFAERVCNHGSLCV